MKNDYNVMSRIVAVSKAIVLIHVLLLMSVAILQAATKTWQPVAGGAWTTAGNWSPSGAPAAGDDVIIGAQSAPITAIPNLSLKSMTINGSCTLQSAAARTLTLGGNAGTDFTIAAGANLTLGTTVNITLANSATATINGTLTVNSTNTFNTNNTSVVTTVNSGGSIVNYGTVTCANASKLLLQSGSTYQLAADVGLPTATWNSNSTLLVTGIANTAWANPVNYDPSFGQSFGNVTWNCPGMSSTLSLGGVFRTINGNFTVLSTGSGFFSFGNAGIGNINIGGNYIQSGGNVCGSGTDISAAARTINIGGNFSMSGGTFNLSTSSTATNTVTVNVTGNFSHTAGTITETGGTTASSITFTAGTHTYTSGGTVSNAVNFNVGAGATLNMASSTTAITGGGKFTLQSGGTLGVSSAAGITATGATGNIQVTGTRTYSAGNINYNGSAPQVTGAGLTAAANVTITNTTGVTFSTAAAITGTLSMGAGTTANLGTGLNHTAGSLLLNGVNQTLSLSYGGTGSGANVINTTYFAAATGKITLSACTPGTWTGVTSTDWNTGSNWCSGTVPTAASIITISAGANQPIISNAAVCNTIFINAGATVTIAGSNSLTVSGAFNNAGSFTTNGGTLTVAGNYTNSGTFYGNTGTLIINATDPAAFTNSGTFNANTGTVNFNGAAQTVVTTSVTNFYNVIIGGSGAKTITAAKFIVLGTLSMESSGTISALPTYGINATLQYNTATARIPGVEWPSPFTPSGGVIIKNTGVITLAGAKTFTACPLTVNDGATLANNGFAITGPNAVNLKCGALTAGSVISGAGLLTLGGNIVVSDAALGTAGAIISCNVSLNTANYDFDIADDGTAAADLTISGTVSTAGSINKIGTGSLVLSKNSNTYTLTTDIAEGEFRLNPVSTPGSFTSAITLSGGILSTTGIAGGTILTSSKTLALSENSEIQLGSNVHTLKFANSSAIPWTAANYLIIKGWAGTSWTTPTSGSAGKIYIGTTSAGLTVAQLSQTKFYDGASYYNAAQLATGEIVPNGPISTTFVSVQSGAWNDPATWGFTGAALAGFTVPGTADNVTIDLNHIVTLTSSVATTGVLSFAQTGTLAMGVYTISTGGLTASNSTGTASFTGSAAKTVTVNGPLITTSGGNLALTSNQLLGTLTTITNNGSILTQNTSSAPIPSGKTWGGSVQYNAATGGQTVMSGTYSDLALSNTSGIQTVSGTITVNGALSVDAGSTLEMSSYQMLGALTAVANNGLINTQNTSAAPLPTGKTWGGTVNYNATTGAQTLPPGTYTTLTLGNTSGTQTASGDLTVTTLNNNTNAAAVLDMAAYTLAAAAINNTGTIITQSLSAAPISSGLTIGGTVNYNLATGGQTIAANTYSTLTMGNTSGTQTANGNIVASTLNNNTNAADILNMETYTLAATTINNTGTIRTQNVSAAPIPSGMILGGTIRYDAAGGGQTVVAQTSYNTLELYNTGGTQTAVGAIVTGTLNTSAGSTFNMQTYALSGISTLDNLGTLRTQNTSATPFTAGLTWGGAVVFDGSAAQTVPVATFGDLTVSNTAGVSAAGNITVNGSLNLSAANPSATVGSLAMGANTLFLGSSEQTTGIGDVTGIITRQHNFAENVSYTFGNANQIIKFPTVAGQTRPTSITVRILLDVAPVWVANAAKRKYEMAQTGGANTKAIFRCNYLDAELAGGSNESLLSYWSSTNQVNKTEMGWSNQDIDANWITISDINMTGMPNVLGNLFFALATSQASILTWNGSISTDWNTTSNWTPNGTPSTTIGVVIPDTSLSHSRSPILPIGASAHSVQILSGGIIDTDPAATLNVSGTGNAWAVETGGIFNAGNSTVTFTGIGATVAATGATSFNNIVIAATTTLRTGTNSYTGISGTLTNNGILDASTTENTFEFKQNGNYTIANPNGSLAGFHNLIISGTGTKTLPATLDIYGDFINNGTIDANAGTVNMNALDGVPHTIGGSSTSDFYNLNIKNSGLEQEIGTSGNFTVSNILDINAGATLTPGAAFTIGGTGTLTGSGTAKVTRLAAVADFDTQYPINTKTLTNLAVDYAGAGDQTVNSHDQKDLIISPNGSRTVTFQPTGIIGVTGSFLPDMTVTNYIVTGSTLEAKGSGSQYVPAFNFYNVTISGVRSEGSVITLVNGGTIGIAGNGSVTATNTSYDLTNNTININGNGNQELAPFAFNNVIFSNGGTKTAHGELSVSGSFTVDAGITLDMATFPLVGAMATVNNNGTVRTSVPTSTSANPIPSGKIWGGTVEYTANTPQTVAAGTYENLVMSGTGGGSAAGDIYLSGTLSLAANTSTTQGILEMGAHTLFMGSSSSTAGTGDVTGIVKRNHLFASGTDYSFGSEFTSLHFLNTGTKPDWVKCKITIGNAPTWHTEAVKRTYSFAQSGGTDRMIVKLHYLDNELNAAEPDESLLVYWDGYDPGLVQNNFVQHYPRNKNANSAADNWVQLTGPAINYLATSTDLDVKQWGLSYTDVTVHTWTGNGSPSYDGDWSLPGNWNGGVPTASDNVLIPAPASLPADNNGDLTPYRNLLASIAPSSANTLEIASGATMTMLDNETITIGGSTGAWVNNGTFNAGGATVRFTHGNTAEPATISGAGLSYFDDLEVADNTKIQAGTNSYIGIKSSLIGGAGSILDFSTNVNTINYTGAGQTVTIPNGNSYSTLILSGTGTKTLPATTLNVSGNFLTNSAISSAGSTIVLDGMSAQTIGGTFSADFDNLSIMNTSGLVTAVSDIAVAGAFTSAAGSSLETSHDVTFNGSTGCGAVITANAGTVHYTKTNGGHNIIQGTYLNLINDNTSGTNIACGNLVVNGELSIPAGGILDMSSNSLSGNLLTISNNGSIFTQNTSVAPIAAGKTWSGSVVFNGSSAQTLVGGTFYDLEFDNTAAGNSDIDMVDLVTVTHQATFNTGIVNASGAGTMFFSDGASHLNAGAGSYVNGSVSKSGSTPFTFPVGNDSIYAPIGVSDISNPDIFTATYYHRNPSDDSFTVWSKEAGINSVSSAEYWDLARIGSANAKVTVSWNTFSGTITDISKLIVAHWNGTAWENKGNSASATGTTAAGTVTSDLFTSFSPVTVATTEASNVLPISLLSFQGKCNNSGITLSWSCASETNNDYFTVERSSDKINWYIAATEKGAGNSSTVTHYAAFDRLDGAGSDSDILYYRLKQTDYNRKSDYSDIIKVVRCPYADMYSADIHVEPNPFVDEIVVSYVSFAETAEIEILDMSGKAVAKYIFNAADGVNHQTINLSDLPSDIYVLTFTDGFQTKNFRIVKK